MRKISAQYLFTSAGKPLRRGIVTIAGDGTVTGVEDTGGTLRESASTEFYNGVIIPGFVNCHAHLELSHMRGLIPAGGGLSDFILSVRNMRKASDDDIMAAASEADNEMYSGGVAACGDISNSPLTAGIKSKSPIHYITFAEAFGLEPAVAEIRMQGALEVCREMRRRSLQAYVTPHSLYSLSLPLSKLIREHIPADSIISLHFLESDDERRMAQGHADEALHLSGLASRLLLVHNRVITREEAVKTASAVNTWFCLCPSSNIYISGKMPPAAMLREVTRNIAVGTDSLASTDRLSMISELLLLQEAVPDITADELIRWGTINGARALKCDDTLGSIEPGKRPGLLLVEPYDLQNMRLLRESHVRRLV